MESQVINATINIIIITLSKINLINMSTYKDQRECLCDQLYQQRQWVIVRERMYLITVTMLSHSQHCLTLGKKQAY